MPHIDGVNLPEESRLPHQDQPDHHRVPVRHPDPRWAKSDRFLLAVWGQGLMDAG